MCMSMSACGSDKLASNTEQTTAESTQITSEQTSNSNRNSSEVDNSTKESSSTTKSDSNSDATQQTVLSTKNNPSETINENNSSTTSTDKNPINKNEVFYGEWEIKKQVASGRVAEYGDDDVKKLIGKRISYSPDSAKFDTIELKLPNYNKTNLSEKEFFPLNYVSFQKLGITSPSIIKVEVYSDKEHRNSWNSTGEMFFIKDENTLILYDGGVYFELNRAN